jgi:DNA polymerase-3 subunit delta
VVAGCIAVTVTLQNVRAIRPGRMDQSTAVTARNAELAALLREAGSGVAKPVYLFIGESFETAAAAHVLLDALVPPARRSFNLETYDGRTTSMVPVIDSVRTPGFFPGLKAVWVRESTLFLSGEKRGDLTEAMQTAWRDGRRQDAAGQLLTLVALAGWSQEQFRAAQWSDIAKTRVREVFGTELEPEEIAQLDAIQSECLARELTVSAFRDDSIAVLELLEAGLPPNAVLLFTASAADARKRLFKRVREIGAVIDLSPVRERSGALSRDTVQDRVRQVTGDFGKLLSPGAREYILRRAGTDPAVLATELEKLCLYVGDREVINEDDVRLTFRDMAESWIFDFTAALAARQLTRVLPLLRGLLAQGEPPLRLLAMVAREVRLLLVARECLDGSLRGKWRPDLQFNAFQSRVLPHLDEGSRAAFGSTHPFVLYRRLQDAARFEGRVLRNAIVKLSDLDLRLKSSRTDPALLLETFIIDLCRAGAQPLAKRTP